MSNRKIDEAQVANSCGDLIAQILGEAPDIPENEDMVTFYMGYLNDLGLTGKISVDRQKTKVTFTVDDISVSKNWNNVKEDRKWLHEWELFEKLLRAMRARAHVY